MSHQKGTVRIAKRPDWTKESAASEILNIIGKFQYIPPENFLRAQGYGGLMNYLRQKEKMSMVQLRQQYSHLFSKQAALYARNGRKYKSYAEVCFADFMWARDVHVEDGQYYPCEFYEMFGHRAIYDFHFQDAASNVVNVEIFGGARGGSESQEKYLKIRQEKEKFNKTTNLSFLSLELDDCYTDSSLASKIEPFFGQKLLLKNFEHERDEHLDSTVWSIADEVMEKCAYIMAKMPNQIFPAQHWFDQTESYAKREKYDWEDQSWAPFLGKMRMMGGLNQVKKLLGLTTRHDWQRDDVLMIFKKYCSESQQSPASLVKSLYKNKNRTAAEDIIYRDLTGAINASKRVTLFQGQYREACEIAGISIS